ncbi:MULTISPECIES: TIGR00297 family protein [unclassified Synechocystis]|uniref:TIGR00297 family protein n=1 Tax=unclassified Synechocystis TaxID=2640012 RepID=UPI00048CF13C|nr:MULTISPECIES: TIGR00297 family protein [unclassified Synechocystis]AIE74723.1 hypothetical protein D082_21950 [Synechocystis sp. PCC 6714]MCT0253925.1 TIGR00297 family protein [Synechocystis sp. CS-94]
MDDSLLSEIWRQSLTFPWLSAVILNSFLLALAAIAPKKLLTAAGYGHAWGLGVIIWAALGWRGYLVVLAYFFVGSAVTRIGQKEKEAAGIAEKRSGQRGPENVWGSALIAALCALAIAFGPEAGQPWLALGYVASFSTKLSDTTASEVGKAYGKSTFLITTLQPVPRGTEGAVSLEGTMAGFMAGLALAILGYGVGLISVGGIIFSTLAAFIATNLESVIGATLQNKWPWLTNEVVNGINTFLGAAIAIAMQATAQLI